MYKNVRPGFVSASYSTGWTGKGEKKVPHTYTEQKNFLGPTNVLSCFHTLKVLFRMGLSEADILGKGFRVFMGTGAVREKGSILLGKWTHREMRLGSEGRGAFSLACLLD